MGIDKHNLFDSFHRNDNGSVESSYYNPFYVKPRRRIPKNHKVILEKVFEFDQKPAASVRKKLSEQLQMDMRAVQVWFQNRRAKEKKVKVKHCNNKNEVKKKSLSPIKIEKLEKPLQFDNNVINLMGEKNIYNEIDPITPLDSDLNIINNFNEDLEMPFGDDLRDLWTGKEINKTNKQDDEISNPDEMFQ